MALESGRYMETIGMLVGFSECQLTFIIEQVG